MSSLLISQLLYVFRHKFDGLIDLGTLGCFAALHEAGEVSFGSESVKSKEKRMELAARSAE